MSDGRCGEEIGEAAWTACSPGAILDDPVGPGGSLQSRHPVSQNGSEGSAVVAGTVYAGGHDNLPSSPPKKAAVGAVSRAGLTELTGNTSSHVHAVAMPPTHPT